MVFDSINTNEEPPDSVLQVFTIHAAVLPENRFWRQKHFRKKYLKNVMYLPVDRFKLFYKKTMQPRLLQLSPKDLQNLKIHVRDIVANLKEMMDVFYQYFEDSTAGHINLFIYYYYMYRT
jgi:hypothetical protein